MKLEITFLRSKVARRIFLLFIICAILPIVALAVISFSIATKQLNDQSQKRLEEMCKSQGQIYLERFESIKTELRMIASGLNSSSSSILKTPSQRYSENLKERFRGLVLITDTGKPIQLFGRLQDTIELNPEDKNHILSGNTFISAKYHPDRPGSIFMGIALNPDSTKQEILLAEIEPIFMWLMGNEDYLPRATILCILDDLNNMLFSWPPPPVSFSEQLLRKMSGFTGKFEWLHEDQKYIAGYRSVPLQNIRPLRKITIVQSESKTEVLAPVANFKLVFPLAILASLWVVLILSNIQIRRSLVPLEKLKKGTQRIAKRDFDSRVRVDSHDEFEELASSFNTMAGQLGRQFRTLTTIAEIDRAVLSTLDVGSIVDTVLSRMPEVFHCNSVSITVFDSNSVGRAQSNIIGGEQDEGRQMEIIQVTPEEVEKLRNNPETLLIELKENPPSYLVPLAKHESKSFLVLPIFLREELSGIITLGYLEPPELAQEDLDQARQLADQVAVAMSNAKLIEELHNLNWGTLRALARAIDAKSSWTAGHSERGTKLALQIGQASGLAQDEIDTLHRGGLLHDIGKLGVPPEILDKPGKLTDREWELMREHCRLGARILEPITAYVEVIPIVEQHHEHFDGKGYPDGLVGEDINLGARVFAVADRFEALTSDRPYRKAFSPEEAIDYVKGRAGSEFDPKVVQAFLKVMTKKERVKWSRL